MANDVIKALQDARKALELEYNEKMKQIDATIALFSGNKDVKTSGSNAESAEKSSTRGRKSKAENAKNNTTKKAKSSAEKKIRFSTSQISQEVLATLSNQSEPLNLKEVAQLMIANNNWEDMDIDRLSRSIYISIKKLLEDKQLKSTKKEGNKKVDYFFI